MTMNITSKKLGKTFYFRMPEAGGYLRVSIGDGPWQQCCHGGGMMGSTIDCGPSSFERRARQWYRQYIANRCEYV